MSRTKFNRGWLSDDEADHIYLANRDLRIPWAAFCVESCTNISAKLAREWAVKLQQLSIRLLMYAAALELELTDTEENDDELES